MWRTREMQALVGVTTLGFASYCLTLASLPVYAVAGGAAESTAGVVTAVFLLVTIALLSVLSVGLSIRATSKSQNQGSVVEVAARQRTLAERYLNALLLARGGAQADPANTASLLRHPEIGRALKRLAGRVSDADMRAMNAAVDVQHRDVNAVVREFLASPVSPPAGPGR